MRRWMMLGLLIGSLTMAHPLTSAAGDDGWAALGGFLGGAIFSEMFRGDRVYHSVVHDRVVEHVGPSCPRIVLEEPAGYYKEVRNKIWHEGYYTYRHDHCGRRIKTWNPGYYTYEYVKVWVPAHHSHHSRSRYAAF